MVMAAAQKVPNKKKALTKKQSAGAAKVPKPSKEVLKKQTKVPSGTNVAERMPKKMKSPDKPNVRKRPAALKKKMKRPATANVRKRPAALKNKMTRPATANVRKRPAALKNTMKRPATANVRKRPAALKNKIRAALKNKIVWKTWPIEFTAVEGGLLYKWKLLGLWLNYKKRTVNEKWKRDLI